MRRFLLMSLCSLTAISVFSQTSIKPITLINERFNSLTFPANWKLSGVGAGRGATWTSLSNTTVVDQLANSGTPIALGSYNWGNTSSMDRSIGFMANGSSAIMSCFRNAIGGNVSSLTLSYTVKRYRTNTASFSLTLFSSTDGKVWAPQVAGDVASSVFATGASSYDFTASQSVTKTITLPVSLAKNGNIYFKWVFTSGGVNAQGIGLDDVSIYAGTATPILSATLTDSLRFDNGIPGQSTPSDVITYVIVKRSNATGNATGEHASAPAIVNTVEVPRGTKASAVANDDNYTAFYGMALSSDNVLTNDIGLPSLSVLSFGPPGDPNLVAAGSTATTNQGGTISLAENGSFTYTPPVGFSGSDQFAYTAGTGLLPNSNAVVTITVNPDIALSTSPTNLLCKGGGSGQIVVTAMGGSGKLSYSIDGNNYQSGNTFSNLTAGTYTVYAKDAAGYIKTSAVTLTEPVAVLSFTTVIVNNSYYGTSLGSITVTAAGGGGTYTYSKNGGTNYQAGNTFAGLAAGKYRIAVKDNSGCSTTQTITLTDPAQFSFTTSKVNITCSRSISGCLTINDNGGTGTLGYCKTGAPPYQVPNVFQGLFANSYSLVVTDADGCTSTGSATLTEPAAITVSGFAAFYPTNNTAISIQPYTKTNGLGRITWSASNRSTGFCIGTASGIISGASSVTHTTTIIKNNDCATKANHARTKNLLYDIVNKTA